MTFAEAVGFFVDTPAQVLKLSRRQRGGVRKLAISRGTSRMLDIQGASRFFAREKVVDLSTVTVVSRGCNTPNFDKVRGWIVLHLLTSGCDIYFGIILLDIQKNTL